MFSVPLGEHSQNKLTGTGSFNCRWREIIVDVGHLVIEYPLAVFATETTGIKVLDISNPQNPVPYGYFDCDGRTEHVQVCDNRAYIAGLEEMVIVDLTHTENGRLEKLGSYERNSIQSVAVDDSIAVI